MRQLEVLHLPALLAHPDRVDPWPNLRAGRGGTGGGGGDSFLLLDKANQDKEKCEKDDCDGEKDGSDESDPSRK